MIQVYWFCIIISDTYEDIWPVSGQLPVGPVCRCSVDRCPVLLSSCCLSFAPLSLSLSGTTLTDTGGGGHLNHNKQKIRYSPQDVLREVLARKLCCSDHPRSDLCYRGQEGGGAGAGPGGGAGSGQEENQTKVLRVWGSLYHMNKVTCSSFRQPQDVYLNQGQEVVIQSPGYDNGEFVEGCEVGFHVHHWFRTEEIFVRLTMRLPWSEMTKTLGSGGSRLL